MTAGEISFDTPALVDGRIRVPVRLGDSPASYLGFRLNIRFDAAVAAFADFQIGNIVDAFSTPIGVACGYGEIAPDLTQAYCILTPQPMSVSGGRTLAFFSFAPVVPSGCLRLHFNTFLPPDLGKIDGGTYTIGRTTDDVVEVQLNAYGPDVFVNIADGSACSPAACISFDPAGCGPEATATPPGSDAQTATAIAQETPLPRQPPR